MRFKLIERYIPDFGYGYDISKGSKKYIVQSARVVNCTYVTFTGNPKFNGENLVETVNAFTVWHAFNDTDEEEIYENANSIGAIISHATGNAIIDKIKYIKDLELNINDYDWVDFIKLTAIQDALKNDVLVIKEQL